MTEWTKGTKVADRYRLESKLGEGGMGEVWRATHLGLDAPVAVKRVHLEDSEEAERRFLREARASAVVRGPNLVQVLDYGVDDGVPFIAMELLEGESLAARIEREGTLPAEEVAWIIADVARGIGRAHKKQIVHRDLKPGNVFLVTDDDGDYAKILDFGIAKTLPAGDAATLTSSGTLTTRSGALLGTPFYMSPEQLDEGELVDHRADLWALAVIAFECLTGRRPFQAESIGKLVLDVCSRPIPVPSTVADVPEGFDAWFARGTERNPQARFRSAQELSDELEALLLDEPPSRRVRPSSHSDEMFPSDAFAPTERARTNSGITTRSRLGPRGASAKALAALALAAAVVGGFVLFSSSDGREESAPGSTSSELPEAGTASANTSDIDNPVGSAAPTASATATATAATATPTSSAAETPPRAKPIPPPPRPPAPSAAPAAPPPPPPPVDLGI